MLFNSENNDIATPRVDSRDSSNVDDNRPFSPLTSRGNSGEGSGRIPPAFINLDPDDEDGDGEFFEAICKYL